MKTAPIMVRTPHGIGRLVGADVPADEIAQDKAVYTVQLDETGQTVDLRAGDVQPLTADRPAFFEDLEEIILKALDRFDFDQYRDDSEGARHALHLKLKNAIENYELTA